MIFKWMIIICREGVSEVTPFVHYDDAKYYFDQVSPQWSESYLCEVKIGPLV